MAQAEFQDLKARVMGTPDQVDTPRPADRWSKPEAGTTETQEVRVVDSDVGNLARAMLRKANKLVMIVLLIYFIGWLLIALIGMPK
jgi:hypothetical protein